MNPTLKTIRAVAVEFAKRVYQPVAIVSIIVLASLLIVSIWLTTMSAWWWILLILVIIAGCIVTAVLVAIRVILHTVRPDQTKIQKADIRRFVDKIQSVADVAGTPKFVILFYIVRDIITKNKQGYVRRISSETLSMQQDFKHITDSFK